MALKQIEDIALMETFQQAEIDGAVIYEKIARSIKDKENKEIFLKMAEDERRHAEIFSSYTQVTKKPDFLKVMLYTSLNRLFGYTFSLKLFERNEDRLKKSYSKLFQDIPELKSIMEEEEQHEDQLIAMIDEERVRYTGSIVLGLNDALVELTGALAGYTLAMRNTNLIAMAGFITGVSATLSMAASGYMSAHADGRSDALKSAVYTGVAYLITVILLIAPYLLFGKDVYMRALVVTLTTAIGIIAIFNGYASVVLNRPFKKGFFEMSALSLGVAGISFIIGILVKNILGINL